MNFDENTFARMIERAPADDTLQPEHERQLRRRVLDVFDLAQLQPARPAFWPSSLTDWRWIMRSPVSRVAAAIIFAVAFGTVALWFHGGGTNVSFADFVKPLLDVHSARFKITTERDGRPPETGRMMVLDPDRMRLEWPNHRVDVMIWDYKEGRNLGLIPSKKRAVLLKFEKSQSAGQQNYFASLRAMLLDTQDKQDVKRESLGEKDIDGRRAVGYRLTYSNQTYELWGDAKAGVPLLVEHIMPAFREKVIYSDFEFNVKLDESLFSTDEPSGYKLVQMDVMPGTEQDLIDMLRAYSNLFDGVFPDTLDVYGTVHRYVEKHHASLKGHTPSEEEYDQMLITGSMFSRAMGFVNNKLSPSANARYAGKGVSIGSAKRPIFWYRPADSETYRVVYSDLSVRDAQAPPKAANAQRVPTKPAKKGAKSRR
jgi:prepilin-type processing-associated H-X9-DG protein